MSASVFPRIPGLSRRRRGMARRLASVIGAVVVAVGILMLPAAATSVFYGEWHDAGWILVSAGITVAVGMVGWRWVGVRGEFTTKEAFATAGLTYFVIIAVRCVAVSPDRVDIRSDRCHLRGRGRVHHHRDRRCSPDPGVLSHGMLIWRAMTQWLGGMGIIVLSIAILPWLGVGGVQLARAEATGPEPSRLTPRFRETAKRLWVLYVALTGIAMLLLALGDMGLFEAIAHGFTTAASGGFGTEAGLPRRVLGLHAVGGDPADVPDRRVVRPALPGAARSRGVPAEHRVPLSTPQ